MSLFEPSCYDSAQESPEGPEGREEGDSQSAGRGAFKTANALTPELSDLERPFLFPGANDLDNENRDEVNGKDRGDAAVICLMDIPT